MDGSRDSRVEPFAWPPLERRRRTGALGPFRADWEHRPMARQPQPWHVAGGERAELIANSDCDDYRCRDAARRAR